MERLPRDGRIPPVLLRARDLAHLCDLRSRAGRRHPSAGFPLAGPKSEPLDTSTRSRNSAVSPAQPSPADLTAPKPSLVQPRLQQRSPAHRSPPQFSTGHPSCSVALPTRADIRRRIPSSLKKPSAAKLMTSQPSSYQLSPEQASPTDLLMRGRGSGWVRSSWSNPWEAQDTGGCVYK